MWVQIQLFDDRRWTTRPQVQSPCLADLPMSRCRSIPPSLLYRYTSLLPPYPTDRWSCNSQISTQTRILKDNVYRIGIHLLSVQTPCQGELSWSKPGLPPRESGCGQKPGPSTHSPKAARVCMEPVEGHASECIPGLSWRRYRWSIRPRCCGWGSCRLLEE